jgi:hypothetical protein
MRLICSLFIFQFAWHRTSGTVSRLINKHKGRYGAARFDIEFGGFLTVCEQRFVVVPQTRN